MTRSITAALLGLGLVAASVVPALAQTVIVPAPSASPATVVAPAPSTTIVVPQGSTVTVTPPAPTTAVVAVKPWCGGTYSTMGGTNFGGCPGYFPR